MGEVDSYVLPETGLPSQIQWFHEKGCREFKLGSNLRNESLAKDSVVGEETRNLHYSVPL